MGDFGKIQPHQTADDKVVITLASSFAVFFQVVFWVPVTMLL